ncbi:uncharacterized protein DUF4190 [Leucobacter komagatae]|uniref:Uncharacterized protein DUF4190 n=1 Tax=Leucobacter komagatae TaxID=55969 RepID=A0A542Y541_9MICO|nr:DUF4190 domain-containing protein [Leucobacter komagatae]TQL43200.1 uncharacterized protein DUF4190 [Leucobacter komagatae]
MDPLTLLILAALVVCTVIVITTAVRRAKHRTASYVVVEKYNTLAILSFVLSFCISIAAIVLGHIALSQITRTHERGWGLAVAGLVLGYLGLIAGTIWLFFVFTQLAAIS